MHFFQDGPSIPLVLSDRGPDKMPLALQHQAMARADHDRTQRREQSYTLPHDQRKGP